MSKESPSANKYVFLHIFDNYKKKTDDRTSKILEVLKQKDLRITKLENNMKIIILLFLGLSLLVIGNYFF